MAFTFFFRDLRVLDLVTDYSVPALLGRSYARVWDAGCAMGPEPYSLAILFAEKMGGFAFNNLRLSEGVATGRHRRSARKGALR